MCDLYGILSTSHVTLLALSKPSQRLFASGGFAVILVTGGSRGCNGRSRSGLRSLPHPSVVFQNTRPMIALLMFLIQNRLHSVERARDKAEDWRRAR